MGIPLSKTLCLSEVLDELRREGICKIRGKLVDSDRVIRVPVEDVEGMARVFKNLGEPNKLRILLLLESGPLPVCVISYVLKLDQTLVSHHLKSLMRVELVESTRVGRFRLYRLTDKSRQLLIALHELASAQRTT